MTGVQTCALPISPGEQSTTSDSSLAKTSGYVMGYAWVEDDWVFEFMFRGYAHGEAFGSSVTMLSNNGDIFVVGAPGFQSGSGRIVVFHKDVVSGTFSQYGQDIIGSPLDALGLPGTFSGHLYNDRIVMMATTRNGSIKEFEYDLSTSQWVQNVGGFSFHKSKSVNESILYLDFVTDGSRHFVLLGDAGNNTASLRLVESTPDFNQGDFRERNVSSKAGNERKRFLRRRIGIINE